jgi:hypothetical protein
LVILVSPIAGREIVVCREPEIGYENLWTALAVCNPKKILTSDENETFEMKKSERRAVHTPFHAIYQ